jgi:hypothetical protein
MGSGSTRNDEIGAGRAARTWGWATSHSGKLSWRASILLIVALSVVLWVLIWRALVLLFS